MSARYVGWEAFDDRSVPTPNGPVVVKRGESVLIVIAPSASECFQAAQHLLATQRTEEK